MNLIKEPYVLTEKGVQTVEKMKKAKWLLDTEHNGIPVSVFWQDEAHPQGSNFFALYFSNDTRLTMQKRLMITNGDFILDQRIVGLLLPNGDVIYSRYRHDYVWRDGVGIDGGRAYTKTAGNVSDRQLVTIRVDEHGSIVIE